MVVWSVILHSKKRRVVVSDGGTSGVDGSGGRAGAKVERSRGEESGQWFRANTQRPCEGDA